MAQIPSALYSPRPWWQRNDLRYENNRLKFGTTDLNTVAVSGTPTYVYNSVRIGENIGRLQACLDKSHPRTGLFYAMKSNRFRPILKWMAGRGNLGIDACSFNEVQLAIDCGFKDSQISYTATGTGYHEWEKLLSFPNLIINADSFGDIRKIAQIAPGRSIGLRINAGVSLGYRQNPKLVYTAKDSFSKFGIPIDQIPEAIKVAGNLQLKVIGIHSHCGCGYLKEQTPQYTLFLEKLAHIAQKTPQLQYINLGGGLGIPLDENDSKWDLEIWSDLIHRNFKTWDGTIFGEPGDYIVKDAGILLLEITNIEMKCGRKVVWLNGGFNIHPEPVFYNLPIYPVPVLKKEGKPEKVTIVGNINEAHDIWMENVELGPVGEGDTIAMLNAGGYGASMSSNHCCRGHFSETLL